ncbi:molecular chaperone DnaJ [Neosynechococcus sphagnicola sy1]|uniref:Molecular chaperone DnaJ n=1 Tax=Neosynechococcus sphagnicola sy1 TaxID=1497020 RepID=A0A098THY7_9CYAN|nr:molecular chaperone DnaJ [Neosynechococcus sphagnicola]KGF71631.1 molecular chaperone DnaJ [Neosynechococcus sphagnicola sy1]
MVNDPSRRTTPEEQELSKKLAELNAFEAELAQRELDLTTMQVELRSFENEYLRMVGFRYTELDRIEEQIAEYQLYLETAKDFAPSEGLKKLYREIAKRIHPDLATDPEERTRRQQLMIEANQAYEAGDEARLQTILQEWEQSPESIGGEGVVAELIRVIRKIFQVQDRLKAIETEIETLHQSELYLLRRKVQQAQERGRNLLADMAVQLEEQITDAKDRLEALKSQLGL